MRLCPIWLCTSDPKFKMLLFSRRQFLYSCYKFWMLFSAVYFLKFDKVLSVLLPIRWSAVRISWFLYLIWGTILFSCILKFKSNLKFDKLSPVLLPFKQPQSESLECSGIYCPWLPVIVILHSGITTFYQILCYYLRLRGHKRGQNLDSRHSLWNVHQTLIYFNVWKWS